MAMLIFSGDVLTGTKMDPMDYDNLSAISYSKNLGSLPTLYSCKGEFIKSVNSYFYDLKAASLLKDISSNARGLLKYWNFLESEELSWKTFPPLRHQKPTYMFRSSLLKEVKEGGLKESTANAYINHVKNFYLWAIHEEFLEIKNEKEAPFKIEKITIQNTGALAHLQPSIIVDSSDLRIRIPNRNNNSLSPLNTEELSLLKQNIKAMSYEFYLQCMLALLSGLRIQEVSSFTLEALNTAQPVDEGGHRHEVIIGPITGIGTKNAKQRTIEVPAKLLSRLKNYAISERRLIRASKLNKKTKEMKVEKTKQSKDKSDAYEYLVKFEPLFISEQGNQCLKSSINARWGELRKIIKVDKPSFIHKFHDLRATYGTFRLSDMLQAGVPPADALDLLMGWMGHNHENTTWKYLRYLKRKEAHKEKFALLDSIMLDADMSQHD